MTRLTRNLPILALTVALFAVVAIAGNALISIDSKPIGTPLKPDYASLSFPIERADDATTTTEASTTTTEPAPTTTEAPTTTVYEPPVTVATTIYIPDSAARVPVGGCCPYNGWAIPEYIVMCESGGDWNAYNPSGAAGPYQLMPGHLGGDARNFSHEAQHAKAAQLWAGGAGASHWAACL